MKDIRVELATCLSLWTRAEDELAVSFSFAVSGRIFRPAIESFFIIRSTDSKCEVANAALTHLNLPDDLHEQRRKLLEKFSKKSKKRNELAHSEIISFPSREWIRNGKNYPLVDGNFEQVVLPFSFFNRTQFRLFEKAKEAIAAGTLEKVANIADVQKVLYLEDINARSASFIQLRIELEEFNVQLAAHVKDPEIGLSVERV